MDKKYKVISLIAIIVLILDQITKYLILKNFEINESIPIIKNIFHLTYLTNTGSAFGLFKNMNYIFILLSFIAIFAVIYISRQIDAKEKWMQTCFGLILGGTLGNLFDRIVHGHVVDFLDFRIWPVFNVADSSITIAAVLLIILLWDK